MRATTTPQPPERLQFTVGLGPCLDASAEARAITATARLLTDRWPEFAAELVRRTPFGAITSVSMSAHAAGLGCVDLYLRDDTTMAGLRPADAQDAVQRACAVLVGEDPAVPPAWIDSTTQAPRNRVPMAIGMLSVSVGVTVEQALALLRGHAFATGSTVDEVACGLADRSIPISALDPAREG